MLGNLITHIDFVARLLKVKNDSIFEEEGVINNIGDVFIVMDQYL